MVIISLLPKTSTATASSKAEISMSSSHRPTKRPSFKQKKTHNWGGTAKVKRCKKRK